METFAALSLVAVYSAMGVYTLAFILFTFDLAKRSADQPAPASRIAESEASVQQAGTVSTAVRATTTTDAPPTGATRFQRVAFALALLGWVLHVGATVLRGVAAGRVPWVNMFEFGLTATAIGMGVFLIAQVWKDLRFLGAYIT
ncbi:MAG: c-type cytochrome biogenesis protein CcsB, partial [Microcella sp.]|nr:c-type cytochrome biogenesis protein CcsB [Microcella sp.]